MNPQSVFKILAVGIFSILWSGSGGASIIYSGPTNILVGGTSVREQSFDVSADGTNDFTIFSDGPGCCNSEIYPLNHVGGIASVQNSFYVTRFEQGMAVGGNLFFAHAPEANIGPGDANLPHEGNFANARGFLGLKLVYAGRTNFAWMDISGNFGPTNTAYEIRVYGWAVETVLNKPILAGDTGTGPFVLSIFRVGQDIEIQWKSEVGKTYQLRTSVDLVAWQDTGDPIPGDGTIKAIFEPIENLDTKFFRMRVQ